MKRNTILMLAITCAFGSQHVMAAQPTVEERLEILQQEIEELKVKTFLIG